MTATNQSTRRSGDDEIVVRIRRRRARPDWTVRRAVAWAAVAVAGDPLLLLIPVMALVAWLLIAMGIGAPARAEVIVPLLTAPPADAYQDIGIAGLAGLSDRGVWIVRILFAAGRTLLFASIAVMAVARARGATLTIASIRASVWAGLGTYTVLGAASFGFALLVAQQVTLDPARDATLAATALMTAMLVLPGAFVAAATGRGPLGAIGRGFATRRPLGHLVLVVGYGAAINGLYRLASFGEPGRPRALPLALYAIVAALATTIFTVALARRAVLLEPVDPISRPTCDPISRPKGRKRT